MASAMRMEKGDDGLEAMRVTSVIDDDGGGEVGTATSEASSRDYPRTARALLMAELSAIIGTANVYTVRRVTKVIISGAIGQVAVRTILVNTTNIHALIDDNKTDLVIRQGTENLDPRLVTTVLEKSLHWRVTDAAVPRSVQDRTRPQWTMKMTSRIRLAVGGGKGPIQMSTHVDADMTTMAEARIGESRSTHRTRTRYNTSRAKASKTRSLSKTRQFRLTIRQARRQTKPVTERSKWLVAECFDPRALWVIDLSHISPLDLDFEPSTIQRSDCPLPLHLPYLRRLFLQKWTSTLIRSTIRVSTCQCRI